VTLQPCRLRPSGCDVSMVNVTLTKFPIIFNFPSYRVLESNIQNLELGFHLNRFHTQHIISGLKSWFLIIVIIYCGGLHNKICPNAYKDYHAILSLCINHGDTLHVLYFESLRIKVLLQKLPELVTEFSRILCNSKVHHHVHKSPPLVSVLKQMNPVRTVPSCFFKICFDNAVP
jgi:hypothetical protein